MNLIKSLSVGVAATAMLIAVPSLALQLPERPILQSMLVDVQVSVGDAGAALNDAIAKLEAAKAEGVDTAAFEAAVEAAKANLVAAQQAEADAAKAAEDAAAQEAEATRLAEEAAAAKAAEEAAAIKAAEDAAAAKAAEDAAAAQAAQEAEAAKAAEEAAAAAKAAEDAAAAKAAEDAAAAQAAQEAEAAKAAEEAAAVSKAAEDAAAAKAAEDAAAAEAAAKAAEEAPKEPAVVEPTPAEPAPVVEPTPAEPAPVVEPAPTEPIPAPADPAPLVDPAVPADPAPAEPAPVVEPVPAEPAPVVDPAPLVDPVVTPVEPTAPVLEILPEAKMEEAAPVLDSAKEELPPPPPPVAGEPAPEPVVAVDPAAPLAPPPLDDAAARINITPVVIAPSRTDIGERLDRFPPPPPAPEETILKTIGDRLIITINGFNMVEAPENPRLVRDNDEVIIEQLSRGRTRETIVRQNGVQVVTIKNRWGEVIQRSRILPDGREVILAYTPQYDREEYVEWRDPVYDLPPLVLRIPVREYTLNANLIEDEDEYYDFLEQPPVERIERTYSVQDVKRSARVRDKARRIEMGNITFGFGTADIEEDQIDKLQGMADAMLKLIKKNPAETFLIEGHTDAVGSDTANLALSDKRAESVAIALNNVFDVPSENLTTQGYGERYLKVKTEDKEPLNRRVVFRRITPLVTPVASAE